MIFASHARGRGFETLTAHISKVVSPISTEERPFALIHGHLISFTPLLELSGLGGVFLCPSSVPPTRDIPTPGQDNQTSCSGDENRGAL